VVDGASRRRLMGQEMQSTEELGDGVGRR